MQCSTGQRGLCAGGGRQEVEVHQQSYSVISKNMFDEVKLKMQENLNYFFVMYKIIISRNKS